MTVSQSNSRPHEPTLGIYELDTIIVPAANSSSTSPATIIFLHGFDGHAQSWADLPDQYNSASRLSHLKWILPNAPKNHGYNAQAQLMPRSFSPIPLPKRAGKLSDEDDEEEDEDGLMLTVEYTCSLINTEVQEVQVLLERIVVGGFSQGCAIALLVGLISIYRGRLGGIVGLSGYLPLSGKVSKERDASTSNKKTSWFLAHGTMDKVVPIWQFRPFREKLEQWEGENVETRIYKGMGHVTSGPELGHLCSWLERVLPVDNSRLIESI